MHQVARPAYPMSSGHPAMPPMHPHAAATATPVVLPIIHSRLCDYCGKIETQATGRILAVCAGCKCESRFRLSRDRGHVLTLSAQSPNTAFVPFTPQFLFYCPNLLRRANNANASTGKATATSAGSLPPLSALPVTRTLKPNTTGHIPLPTSPSVCASSPAASKLLSSGQHGKRCAIISTRSASSSNSPMSQSQRSSSPSRRHMLCQESTSRSTQ